MKKLLWVFAALMIVHAGKVQAQIASFNFSATTAGVTNWTNVVGNPSRQVVSATASGLTISSVATANWAPRDTLSSANGIGVWPGTYFPPDVMTNDWFVDN